MTLFSVALPKENNAKRCRRRVKPAEAITGNPGKALSDKKKEQVETFFRFFSFLGRGKNEGLAPRDLYGSANDPRTANDPQTVPQMVPGPQMIPERK